MTVVQEADAVAAIIARVPGTVLLSGITGSTAYGMAGPDSDVDRQGIFAAPPPLSTDSTFPWTRPPPSWPPTRTRTSPCTKPAKS